MARAAERLSLFLLRATVRALHAALFCRCWKRQNIILLSYFFLSIIQLKRMSRIIIIKAYSLETKLTIYSI